jgi:sigma-E factor negative regulatory protein RseB
VNRGAIAWVAGGTTAALLLLWVPAAGDTGTARQTPPSDPDAMRLLRDAAGAARTTPYEGTEYTAAWTSGGVAKSQVKVVHTTGDDALVPTLRSATQSAAHAAADHDTFQPDAGLTAVSQKMLDLLARNYSVVRAADARISGRPARVVEARRVDGSVAGRFWIDRDTGLLLSRELVDAREEPVTVTGFSALSLAVQGAAKEGPRPAAAQPTASPWGHELTDTELGTLRAGGAAVPRVLPGRLTLYQARESDPDATIQLAYSDGLSAVSVFIQRGGLDERRFAGWRRRAMQGSPLFERNSLQRWAVWAGHGYVYTVLADAPADTTESVVAALPHGSTGFWARPARGLTRMGSWLNPFN